MELGERLRQLRGSMSLRKAAELSGLSHTYIRDVERGINRSTKSPIKPTPETLSRLASAYDYPYERLMEEAGYLSGEVKDQASLGPVPHFNDDGDLDREVAEITEEILIEAMRIVRERLRDRKR